MHRATSVRCVTRAPSAACIRCDWLIRVHVEMRLVTTTGIRSIHRAFGRRAAWFAHRRTDVAALARFLRCTGRAALTKSLAVARQIWHRHFIQLALDEFFDFNKQFAVVRRDKRNRGARCTRAPRATDAVDVVFSDERQLVVHNRGQLIDVKPTCSNVSGNENTHVAVLESFQRLDALVLSLVAVNRTGGEAVAFELTREPSSVQFRARKKRAPALSLVK